MMKNYKIVVEKHPDTYVAYPLGFKGVVVGQGDTYETVLADVNSAIEFHLETFGEEAFEIDPPMSKNLSRLAEKSRHSGEILS